MMNDKHKVFPWMMKTNTLINTMCGLLILAACNMACSPEDDRLPGNSVNPESPEASSPSPIGFSTDASGTRGTGYGPTVLPEAIGVYASQTHGEFDGSSAMMNFMQNQKVEHDAEKNTWSYKPVKFWPWSPADKVSFFAYAPYNATGLKLPEKTVTGYPKLTYTVPATEKEQTDLLVATPIMERNSGDINFSLKHALTKVNFGVKSDSTITVKDLKLTGVAQTGIVAYDGTTKGFNWSGFSGSTVYQASIAATGISIPANGTDATPITSFFLLPDKGDSKFDITYVLNGRDVTETDLTLPETPTTWIAEGTVNYTVTINTKLAAGDILCVDGDGNWYTVKTRNLTETDKTNAIAVVCYVGIHEIGGWRDSPDNYPTINEIHGYAIALKEAHNDAIIWGTSDADIATSVGDANLHVAVGFKNTEYMKEKTETVTEDNWPAFYYTIHYPVSVPNNTSGWYLPGVGEWDTIQSVSTVQNSLVMVGEGFKDSYWTSTEYHPLVYAYNYNKGTVELGSKARYCYVRTWIVF